MPLVASGGSMREFRSLHLQKNLGDVFAAVESNPVVILNRGQPRAVVMSAAEFRRLKRAANEPIPRAALPKLPIVIRVGRREEPLGYDTSDFWACVREMADDALSGARDDAVEAEASRVREALRASGLLPKADIIR
jgi:prevent-host-death family protein